MSAAHTPGPWSVYSRAKGLRLTRFYGIDGANGEPVVLWDKQGGIEMEPDARLIAASPIMYEYIASRAKQGDIDAASIISAI